jgi:hypothetical protein
MGLIRVETKRGHKYELDGKEVKGVTTLLGGGMPKPALPYWSAKMVAEYVADNFSNLESFLSRDREAAIKHMKMVPWTERDKAATRGTDVHAIAETIIHGGDAEVRGEIVDHVKGYVKWLDDWDVEPVLTEKVVANRTHWYAGTFDAVLKFNSGPYEGKTYLCDWKTSKAIYGEMAMQLVAYANAEFYLDESETEQPLPKVDGLAIVHITDEGTSFYEVTDSEYAWESFLAVIDVSKRMEYIDKLMNKVEVNG